VLQGTNKNKAPGREMGSNPSDKYLNTKIPKCLNKFILDTGKKNVITFSKKRMKDKYLKSKIPKPR